MSHSHTNRPQTEKSSQRSGEEGYMLLAVVVMVALVLIALSVAAPVVARDLRRDKEVESEMRAEQYVRAIRLYQRKFANQYPPSIEVLEKSNNIRFLRKQYVDPLTGKSEWRIIHQGQQQTTIKIPFGQELAGIATTGLGSAAGMSSGFGNPAAGGTASSTIGSTNGLAAGFSGATIGGTAGTSGTSGTTGSTGIQSTDATKLGGGGPIVGVGTGRTGDSILTPNGQSTYETWEFWYDPRIEMLYKKSQILGGGGGALGGTGSGSGITSTDSSSFGTDINGKSNSGSGGNRGAGSGSSGTTTPTPTPQQ